MLSANYDCNNLICYLLNRTFRSSLPRNNGANIGWVNCSGQTNVTVSLRWNLFSVVFFAVAERQLFRVYMCAMSASAQQQQQGWLIDDRRDDLDMHIACLKHGKMCQYFGSLNNFVAFSGNYLFLLNTAQHANKKKNKRPICSNNHDTQILSDRSFATDFDLINNSLDPCPGMITIKSQHRSVWTRYRIPKTIVYLFTVSC